MIWALTAFVVFFAAFAQGVVGFGFGLVAMAALPFLWPETFAIPFVGIYSLGVSLLILWQMRHQFTMRYAGPMVLGVVLGVPVGIYFLAKADSAHIKAVLGTILVLYTPWALLSKDKERTQTLHPAWGFVAGIFSGALSAFNTGGPPLVLYTTLAGWAKDAIKVALQITFICGSIVQLSGLAYTGLLTAEVLTLILYLAPSIVLGVVLGRMLYNRIDQLTFKRCLLGGLFVMGVVFLVQAFLH